MRVTEGAARAARVRGGGVRVGLSRVVVIVSEACAAGGVLGNGHTDMGSCLGMGDPRVLTLLCYKEGCAACTRHAHASPIHCDRDATRPMLFLCALCTPVAAGGHQSGGARPSGGGHQTAAAHQSGSGAADGARPVARRCGRRSARARLSAAARQIARRGADRGRAHRAGKRAGMSGWGCGFVLVVWRME